MEYREWTFVDRSDWKQSRVAYGEPDKIQWRDEETSLPCLVHRGPSGAWCGYVGVDNSHPMYEKNYNDVPIDDLHGGLTFSDFCQQSDENGKGICHITDNHEKVWWFGFDCAHIGDVCPKWDGELQNFGDYSSYKNLSYVKDEVKSLAKQLAAQRQQV